MRIARGLWQGPFPVPFGRALPPNGFDVLILCSKEAQPPASDYPGVNVVRAPFDDAARLPTIQELTTAVCAALVAASERSAGRSVLITCWMGRNRSGLVSALALHFLTGLSGDECRRIVQARVPGALMNPHFIKVLAGLPALSRQALRGSRERASASSSG